MAKVRSPAVAGSFYPANPNALRASVCEYLDQARGSSGPAHVWPKALIVPHAGYVYSGPVAASGYVLLESANEIVERVILIGPSHHIPFDGLGLPSNTAFDTPLGRIPIDETSRRQLLELPFVRIVDDAHHWEHSLEVQLPFLQEVLGTFSLVPIAVGLAAPEQVAQALESLWGGDETVIVISSDLSHYFDYDTARRMDSATAEAIETLEPTRIGHNDACGRIGVQGLLQTAGRRALTARTLDLRNSGDTAGSRAEVVGYGTWAFR